MGLNSLMLHLHVLAKDLFLELPEWKKSHFRISQLTHNSEQQFQTTVCFEFPRCYVEGILSTGLKLYTLRMFHCPPLQQVLGGGIEETVWCLKFLSLYSFDKESR